MLGDTKTWNSGAPKGTGPLPAHGVDGGTAFDQAGGLAAQLTLWKWRPEPATVRCSYSAKPVTSGGKAEAACRYARLNPAQSMPEGCAAQRASSPAGDMVVMAAICLSAEDATHE